MHADTFLIITSTVTLIAWVVFACEDCSGVLRLLATRTGVHISRQRLLALKVLLGATDLAVVGSFLTIVTLLNLTGRWWMDATMIVAAGMIIALSARWVWRKHLPMSLAQLARPNPQ